MKKLCLWCVLILCAVVAWAQQDTLKYRVYFTDKQATEYDLSQPEAFLSQKSLLRRQRQHLAVDSTDLPVCSRYLRQLEKAGAHIVLSGKWLNFATVSFNDTALVSRLATLPFVRSLKLVWRASQGEELLLQRDSLIGRLSKVKGEYYGTAAQQIRLSQGHRLHEAGFRGKGITVAVIDAGFQNVDVIESMQNIHLLGTRDFVSPLQNQVYQSSTHGTAVLSCMCMNQPESMVGTAPEASFWLLRSEDETSEYPVEEDYWVAAVEFADSVGVDVLNTSLGYYKFDDPAMNYRLCDLNGRVSLMSQQASLLADKGMLLVCSAGNSGMGTWKKITPPADADPILTVGAVDKNSELAPFSSVGHTADGRIKPDVMAVGVATDIIHTNGMQSKANGTSFSSPILCGMAVCLWQACPTLNVRQLIDLVRSSGDRFHCPDNIYGYGIPDFWKAYQMYLVQSKAQPE